MRKPGSCFRPAMPLHSPAPVQGAVPQDDWRPVRTKARRFVENRANLARSVAAYVDCGCEPAGAGATRRAGLSDKGP